jgi:class 3 adenylate cyclase
MNIRWSPSPEAIRLADAQPWDGPLSRAFRPAGYQVYLRTLVIGTVMYLCTDAAIIWWSVVSARHGVVLLILGLAATVFTAILTLTILLLEPAKFRRTAPVLLALGAGVGGSFGASTVIALVDLPGIAFSALFIEALSFAYYVMRPRWAIALTVLIAIDFAVALTFVDLSPAQAGAAWFTVVSCVAVTGAFSGQVGASAEASAAAEHEARTELAALNESLEHRVHDTVEEVERLGQLRRFLAPQVADAVTSDGGEELLRPHRRRIAVCFCDLRGFTAFTGGAEPEDVVAILDEYYATVGGVLRAHEATIGSYVGDGIMAYFGDPVPSESPAQDAAQAIIALRPVLDGLVAKWSGRGTELGYGIGLSYGYATLGVVGLEERADYTALGSVVNLAARLSDRAAAGQVLMDHAMFCEIAAATRTTELTGIELKGFQSGLRVHSLD